MSYENMTYIASQASIENSNISKSMMKLGRSSYDDFYNWSNENREKFWELTANNLGIKFLKSPEMFLNLDDGPEKAHWLYGAQMNIVESCFQANSTQTAIVFQTSPDSDLEEISYGTLFKLSCRVANGLKEKDLKAGDAIAIDMPMTVEAVAIYLGTIMAGLKVVTVADSFSPEEIKTRLDIAQTKLVFTVDSYIRSSKRIQLYNKVKKAGNYPCIVIQDSKEKLVIGDTAWDKFLSANDSCSYNYSDPEETITILFSSGTTGNPKAIPWNHTTPIKSASDGFYHHDIQEGNVVCWPTNLGWMMGPWLVFATLINKGTIALYYDSPLDENFGTFVQNAKVNMLGVVPSLVRAWKSSKCMENLDWSSIKCFSSTGECSNPEDMSHLMNLAGNKPVIEYCGGTETGGGYITGTIVQDSIPGTFSTPALGGGFIILDENMQKSSIGEVFLLPPIMGLSIELLNRDHHEIYYSDTPIIDGLTLRRHGDQIEKLPNGYFKAQGRVDDAMNLGGIKVSSTQIEEIVNTLDFVKESAAIGVPPLGGGPDKLVLCIVPLGKSLPDDALLKTREIVKSKINPLFKVAECHCYQSLPRTASNKVMRRKLRQELS
ncbi:MAG: AMP-binding protein [Lentisphaeraceae bacterium]|nr:AMP-binding protein [Lentisphaeraceae bacterium]